MKETNYIHKIMSKVKVIAGDDLYYHKVADAGSLQYSQSRAVDILASYLGIFIGMEWKLHKTIGAFSLSRFRQSQYDELDRIVKSGGRALIVIGIYVDKGKHQEIYIIPYRDWHFLITDYPSCSFKKSVQLADCQFDRYRILLSKRISDHQILTILKYITEIQ